MRHTPLVVNHSDRRSRRSAEIRERLFHASLDLFARKGFEETTVEDITEAADVGKGTFFNHFPSKDHILLAFAHMQLERLHEAVEEARHSNEPIAQFARALTERMTTEPARNPGIMRVFLLAFLSNSEVRQEMKQLHANVLDLHTQIVQIGQERGEIRGDLPATSIALVFRQLIFGTLLIWSLYGDDSLQSRLNAAFEILWQGLASRNPPAPVLVVPMFW
jgi:AcrR family transcriptional regulator